MEILLKFEETLSEVNPSLIKSLNPGITRGEIQTFLNQIDLKTPPEDIFSLFNWHNGIDWDNSDSNFIFNFGAPISIDYAAELYFEYLELTEGTSKEYFPIFATASGETLLYGIDPTRQTYGSIYLYASKIFFDDEYTKIYDNFEKIFETSIICYKEEAYTFSEEREFLVDYRKYESIGKQINPKSPYWVLSTFDY
jgi:hypothetical protein